MGLSLNPIKKPGNFMHYFPVIRSGFKQFSYPVSFPVGLWEGSYLESELTRVAKIGSDVIQPPAVCTCLKKSYEDLIGF
jgi:hypothetical protein